MEIEQRSHSGKLSITEILEELRAFCNKDIVRETDKYGAIMFASKLTGFSCEEIEESLQKTT